jgi:Outer membrane protein beta-barrel domain
MEHVNNDMDDLFRKAGDLYPLKTTESNWDGVLDKLREENPGTQTAIPGIITKGNTKKRRWGFLLLLIPLSLGSIIYFSTPKNQQNTVHAAIHVKTNAGEQTDESKNSVTQPGKQDVNTLNKNSAGNNNNSAKTDPSGNKTQAPSDFSSTGEKQTAGANNNIQKSANPKNENIKPGAGEVVIASQPYIYGSDKLSSSDPASFHEPLVKPISLSALSSRETVSVAVKPFSLKSPEGVTLNGLSTETASKSKSNKTQSSKGIFIGLLAGPDWSTVKFQSVKQTGASLGILVGYRFNKRLAVESGFMLDKKYYYSNGEYFNTSKTGLPTTETVNYVTGNCFMFEIPINFRYDFSISKNHGFFASAGLSSYLMKKENYSVNYQGGGGPWTYPDTSYYNSSNNLFSILQLSAGYEQDIGTKTKIRIEPYIKIPLQGIGIGSMPISSLGIYFGITRSFR